MKLNRRSIKEIRDKTRHYYSYERYGAAAWDNAIKILNDEFGLPLPEIGAVLGSKLMRWAADNFESEDYKLTGEEIRFYLNKYPGELDNVAGWVDEDNLKMESELTKKWSAEELSKKLNKKIKGDNPKRKPKVKI